MTITTFGLTPADLAPGKAVAKVTQKLLTVGPEKIAYFETSGKGPVNSQATLLC